MAASTTAFAFSYVRPDRPPTLAATRLDVSFSLDELLRILDVDSVPRDQFSKAATAANAALTELYGSSNILGFHNDTYERALAESHLWTTATPDELDEIIAIANERHLMLAAQRTP